MAAHATAAKAGFLPHGTTAFFRRRLREMAGMALVFGALAILATLVSYRPSDPSLNTATIGAARNFFGLPGAYLADLLLQSFGAAAGLLALAPAAWGWRLIMHRPLPAAWPRLVLLAPAMILAALAAIGLPPLPRWPIPAGLGGAAGQLAIAALEQLIGAWAVAVTLPMICIFAGVIAAPLLAVALGWTLREMAGPFRLAGSAIGAMLAGFNYVARLFAPGTKIERATLASRPAQRRLGARLDIDAALRPAAHPTSQAPERNGKSRGLFFGLFGRGAPRVEPTLFDAAAERGPMEPRLDDLPPVQRQREEREKLVAPKAARPAPGKKAMAAKQRRFDLGDDAGFRLPTLDLLSPTQAMPRGHNIISEDALQQNARLLETVLKDFGINGQIVKVRPGPVVTMYELEPAPGTKTSRVIGLSDDIARSMSAVSVRVAVVPGQNTIGIELPNAKRDIVYLRELLASDMFERSGGKLTLVLGKDIGGGPVIVDLARMPHLLVAGTTGSGKSVAVNAMILSLLYRLPPDQCRFIMIDPKMLELSVYDGIPHLLHPVVTEPRKAVVALKWTAREMENRYRAMAKLGVRNIEGFNARLAEARAKGEVLLRKVQTGFDADTGKPVFEDQPLDTTALPYIVVVVDEMADLMLVAGKDIEATIQRLAQMARAAGIHIIMATQRPSVDVVTGTIKANFPTRISFHVTSKIDSRTILGEQGAEQLLGQGDMLYMSTGGRISRVHGPFVRDDEVEQVVAFLKNQGEPSYLDAITEEEDEIPAGAMGGGNGESGDDLYDQAVALVQRERKASTSFVQRHLQIGYNRAARLIERMEAEGVVSGANHVGKREVLGRGVED